MRSPHWIKVENPNAPAVKREAEEWDQRICVFAQIDFGLSVSIAFCAITAVSASGVYPAAVLAPYRARDRSQAQGGLWTDAYRKLAEKRAKGTWPQASDKKLVWVPLRKRGEFNIFSATHQPAALSAEDRGKIAKLPSATFLLYNPGRTLL